MVIGLITADILMAVAFLFTYSHLPPQIPLFYSRLWGEQQLADTYFIFLMPCILNLFLFFNFYLYHKLFFPNQLVRNIFIVMNWFFIVVTTVFFIKTLFFIT